MHAIVLMCLLSAVSCRSRDARSIARAIDAATDSDELRAALVVFAKRESDFQIHPKPTSWDAHAGIAKGPWQLWSGGDDSDLSAQARRWLAMVQRSGLPGVCGYGRAAARIAYSRAREAASLLLEAQGVAEQQASE